MSTNRGAFVNAAKLNAKIMHATPSAVSLDAVSQGDVIIFKDPGKHGFPNVDSEVGIVHTVVRNDNLPGRAVFTVLPVQALSDFIVRPSHAWTIGNEHDHRGSKIAMGLNENVSYKIGFFYAKDKKGPYSDTIRFIPAAAATLGTEGDTVLKIGKFPHNKGMQRLSDTIQRRLIDHGAAGQFIHDINRADRCRDNLAALTPKEVHVSKDRTGTFEVKRAKLPPRAPRSRDTRKPSGMN